MLPITYISAVLVALVHLVSANFDLNVVRGEIDTLFPWPDTFGAWVLTDGDDVKCSDVSGDPIATWAEKPDLSHGRLGIRCSPGDHCGVLHPDDVRTFQYGGNLLVLKYDTGSMAERRTCGNALHK